MRLTYFLIGTATLVACSARSSLLVNEYEDAGVGGAASSSSSSSTGSGGAGGVSPTFCLPTLASEPRGFNTDGIELTRDPKLVAIDVGEDHSTTLGVRQFSDVVGFQTRLSEVTFSADDWSTDLLGVEVVVRDNAVFGYELGSGEAGRYSAVVGVPVVSGQFSEALALAQDAIGGSPLPPFTLQPTAAPRPLFLTHNGQHYGYARRFGEVDTLVVDQAQGTTTSDYACVLGRLQAEAVLKPNETLLIANTSGRGFDECLNDDGIDGPPRYLQVVRATPTASGWDVQLTYEESLDANVRFVHVAPRSDGAWVVWQRDGGEASLPVMGMLVDNSGQPLTWPMALTLDGEVDGFVEITTLLDQLVIAFRRPIGGPPFTGFQLSAYNDDGTLFDTELYPSPASGTLRSNFSLLGVQPNKLLLGFSFTQQVPELQGNSATYVTRFTCKDM